MSVTRATTARVTNAALNQVTGSGGGTPPPVPFLIDTFNRSAGNLVNSTPDTGNVWSAEGAMVLDGNGYAVNDGALTWCRNTTDPPSGNYSVELRIRTASSLTSGHDVGAFVRAAASGVSWYFVQLTCTGADAGKLQVFLDGSEIPLAEVVVSLETDTDYVIKIQ